MKKLFSPLMLVAAVVLATGCTKVERIDVQPTSLAINETGKKSPLKATAMTADGKPVPDTQLTFTSSDPQVATVDGQGSVVGLKSGTATITVTGAEKSAKVPVEVVIPAAVVVKGAPFTLTGLGSTTALEGQVQDDAGRPVSDAKLEFTSADANIAEVSGTTLTAKAPGSTKITAASGTLRQEFDVTVKLPEVASVAIDAAPATLKVGETAQLNAVAKAADGAAINGAAVTFASSNEKLATVDEKGTVTAVKPGAVTITAKNGDKTADAKITIKKK
ncbi:MAG TPA: Ig-like domain-containing protein [Myxococcaceae bacterium]